MISGGTFTSDDDSRVSLGGEAHLTMAGNDGPVLVSPSAGDGVHIGTADTAGDNLDVDVAVAKGLGFKLRSN